MLKSAGALRRMIFVAEEALSSLEERDYLLALQEQQGADNSNSSSTSVLPSGQVAASSTTLNLGGTPNAK